MNIDYRLKFALFLILAAIVFFMFKANNIFENKIVTHQSKSITFKDDTKPIQIGSTDEITYKIKKGDTLYSLLKQLKINPLLINKIVNNENLNSFKTLFGSVFFFAKYPFCDFESFDALILPKPICIALYPLLSVSIT